MGSMIVCIRLIQVSEYKGLCQPRDKGANLIAFHFFLLTSMPFAPSWPPFYLHVAGQCSPFVDSVQVSGSAGPGVL